MPDVGLMQGMLGALLLILKLKWAQEKECGGRVGMSAEWVRWKESGHVQAACSDQD